MRILFVTPDLFGSHGGIARYGRLALKALTEAPQVDAVDVIALRDRCDTAPDPRYFGPRGHSYRPCAGKRSELIQRVAAALLRTCYDVVIAGHVNLSQFLFLRVPRHRARLNVTLIYGTDAWVRLPWLRRVSLQASDLVLAVSRFTADRATQANHLDSRKVVTLYCCIDPFLSECNLACERHQRANSLLTVGRLSRSERGKGHIAILHALPEVRGFIPNVTYDVVGDGDLKPDLQRLTSRLGLEQHVHFHGSVSDNDLRHIYHSCTAYVMPSTLEGFGLVFLEAMAHSRPIVASRRDAAPEILDNTALFVEPDDGRQLADTIRALLCSPDLQARLGLAGRTRLMECFTFDRFSSAFLNHLEQLMAQRRPALVRADDVAGGAAC